MKLILIIAYLLAFIGSYLSKIETSLKVGQNNDLVKITLYGNSGFFIASVFVGYQQMGLIFDTQRNYTSLMSNKCSTCVDITTYDSYKSKFFTLTSDNYTVEMYKNKFIGRLGKDVFLFKDFSPVNDSEIVLVDQIMDNTTFNFQGYLGLGFTKNIENSLLYKLKQTKNIPKAVYSLLLSTDSTSAELHLGGYDSSLMTSTNSSIFWSNVSFTEGDNFSNWYITSDYLYLNNNLTSTNDKIILNSASNLIRIPSKYFFENLSKIFQKKSECQIMRNSLFRCKCDDSYKSVFPTFTFTIDKTNNQNLTVSPIDYIALDNSGIQSTDSSAYCILFLSPNYQNDYWIMGVNFMNDFYTIFDMELNRIGFLNTRYISNEGIENILYLSMIIIASSIIFFSALFCIYKKLTNHRVSRQQILDEYLRN